MCPLSQSSNTEPWPMVLNRLIRWDRFTDRISLSASSSGPGIAGAEPGTIYLLRPGGGLEPRVD